MGDNRGILRGHDGREEACVAFVKKQAKNPEAVCKAIDEFAYNNKWLMNIGDVKGKFLEKALERAQPKIVLELGAYLGYSALKTIQKLSPDAHIYSIERSKKYAALAREVIEHAGKSHQITIVQGFVGDGGKTINELKTKYGIKDQSIDFFFLDHAKEFYLPDLLTILKEGFLKNKATVFADNVLYPGAPDYKEFMEKEQGKLFQTNFYETYLEYQTKVKDMVLDSIYLGDPNGTLRSKI